MNIVFATGNNDKMREIRQILGNLPVDISSMKEAGIDIDIEENGSTFEENALIKARAVAGCCKDIVLADDSGLEIDFLGKEPGVYSARYLGRETPYPEKNAIILDRLKDVADKDRTARFVCAIAAVLPDGRELVVRGTMEGIIGHEIAGENGFGYDPIFFLPEYGKPSAELSPDEKNAVSHRGKALRMMADKLSEILK